MNRSYRVWLLWIIVVLAISGEGCGTIRTVPSLASEDHPKVYSGTRLDLNAIAKNEERLKKFKAEAPEHPGIDLPFSCILDTLFLPLTLPVAAYEFVFD